MLRAIANQGKTVRIPVYMVDIISKYRKTVERLTQRMGRKPASGEVAKSMRMTVRKINEIEEMLVQPTSLYAPVGDEEGGDHAATLFKYLMRAA